MKSNNPIIVVLTGPESTAKSTLAKQLSEIYGTQWVPEYAREYIENLNRSYTYNDVLKIAQHQIKSYEKVLQSGERLVFFDTFLVITKIWFREVFGNVPKEIENYLEGIDIDLHLLCYPDIKWINDGIRENENKRLYLYDEYRNELDNYNFKYEIIKGSENERTQLAEQYINQLIKSKSNYDH